MKNMQSVLISVDHTQTLFNSVTIHIPSGSLQTNLSRYTLAASHSSFLRLFVFLSIQINSHLFEDCCSLLNICISIALHLKHVAIAYLRNKKMVKIVPALIIQNFNLTPNILAHFSDPSVFLLTAECHLSEVLSPLVTLIVNQSDSYSWN